MLFDDSEGGVIVADGRCGVRLRALGPPVDSWYPFLVEVRAGPFAGGVLDQILMGLRRFGAEVEALYASLSGEARVGGEDKFSLKLVGDGRGGVNGFVEVNDFDLSVHLKFEIHFDQTYLPTIAEAIRREG